MSILFDFHDDLVVEEMNFPWTDPSITAIKAGTPLDEDGSPMELFDDDWAEEIEEYYDSMHPLEKSDK